MRGHVLVIAIVFIFSSTLSSQVPQEEVIERLYHTCKVWGYLKYHHSNITIYSNSNPAVDWDEALLSSINGIMTANDKASYHDSLNVLLFKAGPLNPYIDYWAYRGDSFNTKDFSWMNDHTYLTKEIKDTLFKIRSLFKNEAIGYWWYSSNFPFNTSDNKYYDNSQPNAFQRLLGLFRYWNLIEYTYANKPLLSPSWDTVLKTTIKELLEAKYTDQYVFIMKKMTTNLRDSRAHFRHPIYDSFIGNAYLPFKLRHIDGKTIVTNKPDSVVEVSIGDEVTLIKELPIAVVRENYKQFAEGANSAAIERNIDEMICKGDSGFTLITLQKANGHSYVYKAHRSIDNLPYFQNIPKTKSLYDTTIADGCSFGIIDLRKINWLELNRMNLETIWYKDAWILDFRGIPATRIERFLIHYVFNEYKEYYFSRKPNLNIPGEFFSQKTIYSGFTKPKRPRYGNKIILLVDEYTQKEAEYDALCFKERENIMVIGSTTDGAGTNHLAQVYLPGNIYTTYTFANAENKEKESYYKIGIPLDTFVRPTIEDIRGGKDVVLEAALKCANTKLGVSSRKENLHFQVYPNPVIDNLVIENPSKKSQDYSIYNLLGKQVAYGKLVNGANNLNLEQLSKGFYLIQIENFSFKLIKEE
jgi:hypothetical protein